MNELITLINTDPEESTVQKFFEKHPASIIGTAYALSNALITKLPLGVDFVTDFTWVNPRSGPTYVYLVEIEKPSKSIFNKDDSFTQNFNHAYGQVEDWLGWYARNQDAFRDILAPLKSHNDLPPFFAVRGILIYGRDSELNNNRREERWVQKGLSNPFIEVRTYDGWAREKTILYLLMIYYLTIYLLYIIPTALISTKTAPKLIYSYFLRVIGVKIGRPH